METFREIVGWAVALSGFLALLIFLPQIRLLIEVKDSRAISLWTGWGSFAIQAITLLHAILRADWYLMTTMLMSLILLCVMLYLVHYYRWWPGGQRR